MNKQKRNTLSTLITDIQNLQNRYEELEDICNFLGARIEALEELNDVYNYLTEQIKALKEQNESAKDEPAAEAVKLPKDIIEFLKASIYCKSASCRKCPYFYSSISGCNQSLASHAKQLLINYNINFD